MKKILLLSLLFIQPSFAEMMCDTGVSKYFAVYEENTYTCAPGYYLPANTDGCQICNVFGKSCPGGTYTFNETEDQGISIGTYTCNSGYFLPANSDTCRACPTGWTCPGGTYIFNTDKFQGLELGNIETNTMNNICAANFPGKLFLIYEPNQHTCLSGYYLPAGVDECTICPLNNTCSGGTLTFNETTPQGITACPNGTYAPTGSTYCYEHILHIGDNMVYLKSTKITTPSLNIGIGNDVFYANMTTTPTLMNKDSEHYLKLEYDNTVYYVCDDTTCGE